MKSMEQRRQALISKIKQLQMELDNLKRLGYSSHGYMRVQAVVDMYAADRFDSKLQW